MAKFVVMLRGGYESFKKMTPEETQQSIQRYRDWTQTLVEKGILSGGDKLNDDGVRYLNSKAGNVVLDGPFPETKETIGGIITIEATDYDEAASHLVDCPIFSDGGNIELREIDVLD